MKEDELNNVKFYIGQNAQENWDLFDKSLQINENYIWFHLNSFSSPYVIMYSSLEELLPRISESGLTEYLNYGANLCKDHSKYKFLNDLKIIYCPLKKLRKGVKVGEVIVKGKKTLIKL